MNIFNLKTASLIFALIFAGLLLPPAAIAGKVPPSPGSIAIEVKDGRVSARIENGDRRKALEELAAGAGILLEVHDGVSGKVSAAFADLTVTQAIERLCDSRTMLFEYRPETETFQVIAVGAFQGQPEAALLSGTSASGKTTDTAAPVLSESNSSPGSENRPAVSPDDPSPPAPALDSKGRLLYKPGELLIRFKTKVPPERRAALHAALGSTVLRTIETLNIQSVRLKQGLSESEARSRYMASGIVAIAEKHALRYAETSPDDPYWGDQWGPKTIGAPEAWNYTRGSPETLIAVIDTGVNYLHPDLGANIQTNLIEESGSPGVDDDDNGYVDDIRGWDFAGIDPGNENDADNDPMDIAGHGTHVAGIIAAVGNNNEGVAGVGWHLKLLPVKVQADTGDFMETVDIIAALQFAAAKGARIINCSFGGEQFTQNEYDAFESLAQNGIMAVCAAGNSGYDLDDPDHPEYKTYPAAYDLDNIISVAASTADDALWFDSNYGAASVDLMAPGSAIKSTLAYDTLAEVTAPSGVIAAVGMSYAGTTDESGLSGPLFDCGFGYPSEFPADTSGYIALMARGSSDDGTPFYFYEKAANAQAKGAAAAIIYNNESGSFGGTLVTAGDWIPVVSIAREDGLALVAIAAGHPAVTVRNVPSAPVYQYGYLSGTSMAAPHVSGVAGLLLSLNPALDAATLKAVLLDTVDKLPSVSGKLLSGGRLNARSALCRISPLRGDVSCDNALGLEDVIAALKALAGLDAGLCQACISAGIDVNGDGRIGLDEALYALQQAAGMR